MKVRIPFWLEVTGWIVFFTLAPFPLVFVDGGLGPSATHFLFLFSMSLIGVLCAGALCYFILQQLTGKNKHFRILLLCGLLFYFAAHYLFDNYWIMTLSTVAGYVTGYFISGERNKEKKITG
jgi:general stress protein CsbA